MAEVELVDSRDPGAETLRAVWILLQAVFEGRFTVYDWEHALGGVHVLLREDGQLVGHGSVVERWFRCGGVALRTGYVEAVAVRADRQGRGYGALVMGALERELDSGWYGLAALASARRAVGFYLARGWQQWTGPTSVLTPWGSVMRTAVDDGRVYVRQLDLAVDLDSGLTCDWREGEVW